MQLRWINHASYLVAHEDIALVCDPWLSGDAFDHGWSLLSETQFTPDDFAGVTHIWFSHEHPDHFSPPNLKQIPAVLRAEITIIYQETLDKRVASFCRGIGFKEVIEVAAGERLKLSDHVSFRVYPYIHGDSWSCMEVGDLTLVNLNDCVVNSVERAEEIARLAGPVDILFTQFSNAQGIGNPEESERRQRAADKKLKRIQLQITAIKPRYVVPFASFIWFSHIENSWHNDGVNTIHTAVDFINTKTASTAICLYPEDKWDGLEPLSPVSALARYQDDYERIDTHERYSSPSIDIATLKAQHTTFMARLFEKNRPLVLHALYWSRRLQPTYVHVIDLDCCIRFDLHRFKVVEYDPSFCDISISSSALGYCFRFEWGGDTLSVNGRFIMPPEGDHAHFKRYFSLANFNNKGQTIVHYLPLLRERMFDRFRSLSRRVGLSGREKVL